MFPNISMADTWLVSLDPLLPGLETEAQEGIWWWDDSFWNSQLQFPCCHSVLSMLMWDASVMYAPEQYGLVLLDPSHVAVCIVCELKDVWQQRDPPWSGVSTPCSIIVQDRVCIWQDIFVGVYYDECWHANASVYVVRYKMFMETVDNDIVRKSVKGCQV